MYTVEYETPVYDRFHRYGLFPTEEEANAWIARNRDPRTAWPVKLSEREVARFERGRSSIEKFGDLASFPLPSATG